MISKLIRIHRKVPMEVVIGYTTVLQQLHKIMDSTNGMRRQAGFIVHVFLTYAVFLFEEGHRKTGERMCALCTTLLTGGIRRIIEKQGM